MDRVSSSGAREAGGPAQARRRFVWIGTGGHLAPAPAWARERERAKRLLGLLARRCARSATASAMLMAGAGTEAAAGAAARGGLCVEDERTEGQTAQG